MTIRRDLQLLARDGKVLRVAGGAALPAVIADAEPFDQRSNVGVREKQALAREAMQLPALHSARSLALDAGTTVAQLAPHLPAQVLVATHSVPLLSACAERGDLELIGLGGAYQPATRSFGGPATRSGIEQLAVDAAVLSAVAVSDTGLFCANPLDAETKGLLIQAAKIVVVLADHSKMNATAPLRFATWDQVDVLVTDTEIDAGDLVSLREVTTVSLADAPIEAALP